jgi:hypothetical protein
VGGSGSTQRSSPGSAQYAEGAELPVEHGKQAVIRTQHRVVETVIAVREPGPQRFSRDVARQRFVDTGEQRKFAHRCCLHLLHPAGELAFDVAARASETLESDRGGI